MGGQGWSRSDQNRLLELPFSKTTNPPNTYAILEFPCKRPSPNIHESRTIGTPSSANVGVNSPLLGTRRIAYLLNWTRSITNYYSFPVSSIYPNFASFLPHNTYQTKTSVLVPFHWKLHLHNILRFHFPPELNIWVKSWEQHEPSCAFKQRVNQVLFFNDFWSKKKVSQEINSWMVC